MSAARTDIVTLPRRGSGLFQALLLPTLLLIAWQVWASTLPANTRAPSPTAVAQTFIALVASGELPISTAQSLARVAMGFAVALVFGVTLGVLMGASQRLRANLDPIIESFRPIAPMAILPIAILWLGTGTPTSVSIVAYAAFFPLLVNTIHGVGRVERNLVNAARTMGISRLRILASVVVPAALSPPNSPSVPSPAAAPPAASGR